MFKKASDFTRTDPTLKPDPAEIVCNIYYLNISSVKNKKSISIFKSQAPYYLFCIFIIKIVIL